MDKGTLLAFCILAILVSGSILAVLWTEPLRPIKGGCQVITGELADGVVPPPASLDPYATNPEPRGPYCDS